MKISILTPTYNRENLLKNLYNSLIENSKYNVDIEWIIMDDGSTDNAKELIQNYIKEGTIEIKYFYQENQGNLAIGIETVSHSVLEGQRRRVLLHRPPSGSRYWNDPKNNSESEKGTNREGND